MIITGHQPNYLPYIGIFHKIACADIFIALDNVQFVKSGKFAWMHRNRIRTKEGWIWLTVPVLTKGKPEQLINEVQINNDFPWRKKHFNAIYQNYHRSQYFSKYIDFFKEVYNREWNSLLQLNTEIINYLLKQLNLEVKVIEASEIGASGKATDYIIDICKKVNADNFIFGKHGKEYADEAKLKQAGITAVYQKFNCPEYEQQYKGFEPDLSIIDLLFNHGLQARDILRGGAARRVNAG